jgi:hypothetical protein
VSNCLRRSSLALLSSSLVLAGPVAALQSKSQPLAPKLASPQVPAGKLDPQLPVGTPVCGVASVVSVDDSGGLNAPNLLAVDPPGSLPTLGSATFQLSVREDSGACGLLPGARATIVFNTSTGSTLVPGWGCAPGSPGELLLAANQVVFLPSKPWPGPGFPAAFPLPIPLDPVLCGTTVYAQGALIDFLAPTGVVLGNRLDLTLGFDPGAAPDECSGAQPIGLGLTSGNNFGSTTSAVGPNCSAFGPVGTDVWYRFTAPGNGGIVASFCAPGATADFDTALAAFTGSCGQLTPLTCNDDLCDLLSEITFSVTAGQEYFLSVGGFLGQTGSYTLSLAFLPPPANDECASALTLATGFTPGSNAGSTNSPVGPNCSSFGPIGADVWYQYVPPQDGFLTAGFCTVSSGATFDTALALYDGSCGALNELACNDDTCGLLSSISAPVSGGVPYYLAVGGFGSAQGSFVLDLQFSTQASPDECVGAVNLTTGTFVGSTAGSTTSATGFVCSALEADTWFAYTAPCTGTTQISLCTMGAGANFDTVLAAFGGTCASLSLLACNDDTCGLSSQIQFPTVAGTTYFVALGGFAGATGNYTLSVSCQ